MANLRGVFQGLFQELKVNVPYAICYEIIADLKKKCIRLLSEIKPGSSLEGEVTDQEFFFVIFRAKDVIFGIYMYLGLMNKKYRKITISTIFGGHIRKKGPQIVAFRARSYLIHSIYLYQRNILWMKK